MADITNHLDEIRRDIDLFKEHRVDDAVGDAIERIHTVLTELDARTRE